MGFFANRQSFSVSGEEPSQSTQNSSTSPASRPSGTCPICYSRLRTSEPGRNPPSSRLHAGSGRKWEAWAEGAVGGPGCVRCLETKPLQRSLICLRLFGAVFVRRIDPKLLYRRETQSNSTKQYQRCHQCPSKGKEQYSSILLLFLSSSPPL